MKNIEEIVSLNNKLILLKDTKEHLVAVKEPILDIDTEIDRLSTSLDDSITFCIDNGINAEMIKKELSDKKLIENTIFRKKFDDNNQETNYFDENYTSTLDSNKVDDAII